MTYTLTNQVPTGQIKLSVVNGESRKLTLELHDNSYKVGHRKITVAANGATKILLETKHSHGWYDFSVRLPDAPPWEYRYAGRVETGKWSYSDPAMGHASV